MGDPNDLYADSNLPDASLPAVVYIGLHVGANFPVVFLHVVIDE